MRTFFLGLLGLLFTLGVAPALEAQQAEQLRIVVVVEDAGAGAEFTQQQLKDAVTVLITSKAPDVRVASNARLWLHIVPACVELLGGWSCNLAAAIEVPLVPWSRPFGGDFGPSGARVSFWRTYSVLAGPPGTSLRQMREALDNYLDEPIAGWRRLSEEERECWVRFLNNDFWDEASWERAGGSLHLALYGGPCR